MKPDLTEIITQILTLQLRYTPNNTLEMQQRGRLVKYSLKELIYDNAEAIEKIFSRAGYRLSIEGSDGKGRKCQSPWLRLYDAESSKSATQGWYVVIHFSSLGDYFYSAINCGSTRFKKDGSLVPIPDEELYQKILWAENRIKTRGLNSSNFTDPLLLSGNNLSRQFEKSTLVAKRYSPSTLKEPEFWQELEQICLLLTCLYDGERQGKSPNSDSPEIAQAEAVLEKSANPHKKQNSQGRLHSYEERRAVELRAMELAKYELEKLSFSGITDMSAIASYDFSAQKDGIDWLVEVKGTTSNIIDKFLLTSNEHALHHLNIGRTALVIVHSIELKREENVSIASGGVTEVFQPWNPNEWDFLPTAYIAHRKKAKPQSET